MNPRNPDVVGPHENLTSFPYYGVQKWISVRIGDKFLRTVFLYLNLTSSTRGAIGLDSLGD